MTWLRKSIILLFALSLSAAAGCGDDGGQDSPDAGQPPDSDGGLMAPDAGPGAYENAEAHWVTETLLAIPAGMAGDTFELYHAPEGGMSIDAEGRLLGGTSLLLTEESAGLPQAVTDKFPHLAGYRALSIPDIDEGGVAQILRGQLALVATTGGGTTRVTGVQIPGVLDDLYTYDGALGVSFEDGAAPERPTFRLWAPTARSVALKIYGADKGELATEPMTRDDSTGVWSYTAADETWYGSYYRYEVEVFAPRAAAGDATTVPGQVVKNLVTDPYSVGLATNSAYSLIIDLDDPDTQPPGWDGFALPESFDEPEDIALYEVHVRDFSIHDDSVDAEHRGKYLAFTYTGDGRPLSDGMAHLQRLADVNDDPNTTTQGITHVHLLPVFDIATIDEDVESRIDIDGDSSFGALCDLLGDEVAAGDCASDGARTIRAVLEDLLGQTEADGARGDTEDIQAVVDSVRDRDGYNWGYDPFHYTAPEGSYATDPEGVARIRELREMVMGLGAIGLRTVMDVVYNHTNSSGQNDKSVLDKIVPGYYHRQNPTTGEVERSTCCENTATEHAMMEKLMLDSLATWSTQYKIAGFRFDLMGHHMKSNMEKVLEVLKDIDATIYVYGEGWDFGEVVNGSRGVNATQLNMAGTGIGTFSDRLRDAVRGGGPFDSGDDLRINQGFVNGMFYDPNDENTASADDQKAAIMHQADLIRVGMAGNLADFVLTRSDGTNVAGADVDYNGYDAGYTLDPQEVITYVAAHDNQTLFDNNQYKIPAGRNMEVRLRAQNLALAINILGQGIPFLHMGSDILRSKSMARDSYDYGDWFNKVDFSFHDQDPTSDASSNWNVGLPPKEKDSGAYDVIKEVIADEAIAPKNGHVQRTHAYVRAMLRIRRSSPLFRLRTGDEVKTRVDFHNVGESQSPGLVLMTVTDGSCAGDDLDPILDNVAILINATDEAQSFDVTGTPLDDVNRGWTPHQGLDASAEPLRSQIFFEDAVFRIPARATGVFVDPQGDPRDTGLCNDKEAEEVTPPGGDVSKDVYLRGTLTTPEWDALDDFQLVKVAENRYEVEVPLAAGSYQLKVADADWSTHNWGGTMANVTLAPGETIPLAGNGANITLQIGTTGDHRFVLNTSNLEEPQLTLETL